MKTGIEAVREWSAAVQCPQLHDPVIPAPNRSRRPEAQGDAHSGICVPRTSRRRHDYTEAVRVADSVVNLPSRAGLAALADVPCKRSGCSRALQERLHRNRITPKEARLSTISFSGSSAARPPQPEPGADPGEGPCQ